MTDSCKWRIDIVALYYQTFQGDVNLNWTVYAPINCKFIFPCVFSLWICPTYTWSSNHWMITGLNYKWSKYNTKWSNYVWGSPCSMNPFSGINEQQRRGYRKKINGDCIVSDKLENTSPKLLKNQSQASYWSVKIIRENSLNSLKVIISKNPEFDNVENKYS